VLSSLVAGLTDLVLPGGCAGCQGDPGLPLRYGVCDGCAGTVAALRPYSTAPDPAPAGMPPCTALGPYDGVLRELILAYKDRGRYRLARPLGRLLAEPVASTVEGDVLLVPIPDTPAAARARHGDHMQRLARHAALRLREAGIRATVARPLRARSRRDSTGLDAAERAAEAQAALRPRPLRLTGLRQRVARTGEPVILLDDVVTTGATLAAAAAQLAAVGIPVTGAAVLAATRRTHPPTR
jgi:predicted amidophosphoribosyltransferase